MTIKNLRTLNDSNTELTEEDKEELFDLLKGRSRSPARAKLGRVLDLPLSFICERLPSWMQERIHFDHGRWQYCAGQDYPSEITLIRNTLIN